MDDEKVTVDSIALDLIIKGCSILGWEVAVPDAGDEPVGGLVIGTKAYLDEIIPGDEIPADSEEETE